MVGKGGGGRLRGGRYTFKGRGGESLVMKCLGVERGKGILFSWRLGERVGDLEKVKGYQWRVSVRKRRVRRGKLR